MSNSICRVCLGSNILPLLDFGKQPNTFNFLANQDEHAELYDFVLHYCTDCGFVFIENPIPSDILYNNYHWPTSSYPADHLNWLVELIINNYLKDKKGFILDIGANDGYLLKLFKERGYDNLLGVEPAKDCASQAGQVNIINNYFNYEVSSYIKEKCGMPDVIIFRHVLEHIWDIDLFFKSITLLVHESNLLVIEIPSFDMILKKGDISSFWEQHVNYFSHYSINRFLSRYNLYIHSSYILPFGGGSLLLFITPDKQAKKQEIFINRADDIIHLKEKVSMNIRLICEHLERISSLHKRIVAYGAGARGIQLLHLSKAYKYIDYFIDDNINKAGLFIPMSGLPVKSSDLLCKDNPDYCLITPLNNKDLEKKIVKKHSEYRKSGGKFIEVFPEDVEKSNIIIRTVENF